VELHKLQIKFASNMLAALGGSLVTMYRDLTSSSVAVAFPIGRAAVWSRHVVTLEFG